jgi:hypothetical protein
VSGASAQDTSRGLAVSAEPSGYDGRAALGPVDRQRPGETVAGFLAAAAITVSAVAMVYRPVRLAPCALLVALVAVALGGRHARLSAFAVAAATVGWLVGMTVAVITEKPLF